MNLVESVYELSESFMKNSTFVELNEEGIAKMANKMKEKGTRPFPMPEVDDPFKEVLIELVASSINYCYWYGKSSLRPQGCGSGKMYEQVVEAFKHYKSHHSHSPFQTTFKDVIDKLSSLLAVNRFPLLEERIKHINELIPIAENFAGGIMEDDEKLDCLPQLEILVSAFPGFASDQFLKRASLFFLQLYRKFGWYEPSMLVGMHVPADYQVPKVLEYEGCINYAPELKMLIEGDVLLPKYSLPECEIRAATTLACKALVKQTGWNISQVDAWFWLGSKKLDVPFHLTVTTDY